MKNLVLKIKNTKKSDGYALNATFIVNTTDSIDIETTIDAVLDPDQNVENYLMTDMNGNIKPNNSPEATEYLSPAAFYQAQHLYLINKTKNNSIVIALDYLIRYN